MKSFTVYKVFAEAELWLLSPPLWDRQTFHYHPLFPRCGSWDRERNRSLKPGLTSGQKSHVASCRKSITKRRK